MRYIIIFGTSMIAYFLVLNSVSAQTEELLKQEFFNKKVISKIELPAYKSGIYLYPYKEVPVDVKDYSDKIEKYGFSIYSGDTIIIQNIKVKKKHIEVHVMNFNDERQSSKKIEKRTVKSGTKTVTKREYERLLRQQQMNASSNRHKGNMKYYNGSRFNIKLGRKVTAEDLTAESLMNYLADYIEFESIN